jgi:TetR/AcrR family transcriptional repressor of nem operon
MKLSKEQAARNRERIVEAAGRLFREQGVDGVGVADVMKAAGFTHGGFYNHFPSKDALAAEACESAFARSVAGLRDRLAAEPDAPAAALSRYVEAYLSLGHRDDTRDGCPMALFAADSARQGEEIQTAFADGIEAVLETVTAQLAKTAGAEEASVDARVVSVSPAHIFSGERCLRRRGL